MYKEPELLTIDEAAQFLNIKVSNLRSAVFRRRIRYFKVGALIRFNKADLILWLEEKIVQPLKNNSKRSY
jgi:excisionase family DNA binding protein